MMNQSAQQGTRSRRRSIAQPSLCLVASLLLFSALPAFGQEVGDFPGVADFDGVPVSVPGGATEALLFYLFGGTVVLSAVGVCVCKSIVRMATCLFFTLGAVAVVYFLLGAAFLGAIQLIVYAGGTLILLVFGVMLTSKSPWVRYECPPTEIVAAGGVALSLLTGLVMLLTHTLWPQSASVGRGSTVAEFGKELLTTYLVPFEVASVLLLVVMIGAAYLARQEK